MNKMISLVFITIIITSARAENFHTRLPQDEVIYFLLPDRFENGDITNDKGGLTGDRLTTGYDPTAKGFYHGGDLKGLTSRLDYIQGLGATAIWLGPVYKNKAVQGAPGHESAGYHGYWITDFTQVDPHFGTNADLKKFINAAHLRKIKIYLDVITNHTADVIQHVECGSCAYRSLGDYPDAAYAPVVPEAERHVKKPEWLNDPKYYHNRGDSTFHGENFLLGDISGLDDLKTEDPKVIQGFIDIYAGWIENYKIDGFRIDTVKHVNAEFWQAFIPAMQARAKVKGILNFHIFGEVYNDEMNPGILAKYTRVDKLPAVLDFAFRSGVLGTIAGQGGTDILTKLFEGDVLYEGGAAAALQLPTFISNHDAGRFAYFVRKAFPTISDEEQLKRITLAYAMMFTLRGIPVIYSGDEQGFVGHGGDQDAREDMFASKVASYNDTTLPSNNSSIAVSHFNTDHRLYKAIASLAHMRTIDAALRRGLQTVRTDDEKPGLFVVSRIDPDSGHETIIAFNTSLAPITRNIRINSDSHIFHALYGTCSPSERLPKSYSLSVPPLDYVVCTTGNSR